MDEIATALDETTTESPGEPTANQLQISFQNQGLDGPVNELLEKSGDTGD